jgi:hypothetical protein
MMTALSKLDIAGAHEPPMLLNIPMKLLSAGKLRS